MSARVQRVWVRLRTSYWFVPGLLVGAAAALAAALISGDAAVQARGIAGLDRIDLTGPEGARILLSTIAGSAITVAALVFSITMVVLSTASAQFGPRLLRNFMRHNATQVVMGVFVGTFVYCLITLAAVRSDAGHEFVPQSAVAGGLALGVLAFALLFYFIDHVSRFVQATHVIADVARGLERAVRSSFPERTAAPGTRTPDDEESDVHRDPPDDRPIVAQRSGYVEAIDASALVELAGEADLVIRLGCRPGHFVIEGRPLASVAPPDRVDDALAARIAQAILTGPERTSIQDPEFAVHQLVEVALRALSPGLNDPYTALNCIDRLAAALSVLAGRALPSRYVRDADGKVRLVADPFTYGGVVEAAFNQIRQAAIGNLAVQIRLLEAVETVAQGDLPGPFRDALRVQVDAIRESGGERFQAQSDRATFYERVEGAFGSLADEEAQSATARTARPIVGQ
jgi:uncharacterized membrane protein